MTISAMRAVRTLSTVLVRIALAPFLVLYLFWSTRRAARAAGCRQCEPVSRARPDPLAASVQKTGMRPGSVPRVVPIEMSHRRFD
jgi:hypothetical protein